MSQVWAGERAVCLRDNRKGKPIDKNLPCEEEIQKVFHNNRRHRPKGDWHQGPCQEIKGAIVRKL